MLFQKPRAHKRRPASRRRRERFWEAPPTARRHPTGQPLGRPSTRPKKADYFDWGERSIFS
jgi:hypothetical protein